MASSCEVPFYSLYYNKPQGRLVVRGHWILECKLSIYNICVTLICNVLFYVFLFIIIFILSEKQRHIDLQSTGALFRCPQWPWGKLKLRTQSRSLWQVSTNT